MHTHAHRTEGEGQQGSLPRAKLDNLSSGNKQQQEASIQIIEQDEYAEEIIIPQTHKTVKSERTRVLLYLESIMSQTEPSDANLDKLMPWKEFKKALIHQMPDMSNDQLKGVFKFVDQDKDGKVSLRQCLEKLRAHATTCAALKEPPEAATAADTDHSLSLFTQPLAQVQTAASAMPELFMRTLSLPNSLAEGNGAESMQTEASRRDSASSAGFHRSSSAPQPAPGDETRGASPEWHSCEWRWHEYDIDGRRGRFREWRGTPWKGADPLAALQGPASDAHDGENLAANGNGISMTSAELGFDQVQTTWTSAEFSAMPGLFMRTFSLPNSLAEGNGAESMQTTATRRDSASSAGFHRSRSRGRRGRLRERRGIPWKDGEADPLATLQGPASDAHDGENLAANGNGMSMTSTEFGFAQVQTTWTSEFSEFSAMPGLFMRTFSLPNSLAEGNGAESMQTAASRRDSASSAGFHRSSSAPQPAPGDETRGASFMC